MLGSLSESDYSSCILLIAQTLYRANVPMSVLPGAFFITLILHSNMLTLFPATHELCCLLSHMRIFLDSLYCEQYGP